MSDLIELNVAVMRNLIERNLSIISLASMLISLFLFGFTAYQFHAISLSG
jgi:hypothetical protein